MKTYTVKSGDSLNEIATREKVPFDTICKLNEIKSPYKISVGQKLKLEIDKKEEK